ncbi:MAG: hypothetical protein WB767_05490, partial [Nocardioides sp.]
RRERSEPRNLSEVEQSVRGTSDGVVETPAAHTTTPLGSPGLDDARWRSLLDLQANATGRHG